MIRKLDVDRLENILTAFFQSNGSPERSRWYQQLFPSFFRSKDGER
jgi:hypothetical protein